MVLQLLYQRSTRGAQKRLILLGGVGRFFTKEEAVDLEVGGKSIHPHETFYTNSCRCLKKFQAMFWERKAPS